jgi:hypothetical protein
LFEQTNTKGKTIPRITQINADSEENKKAKGKGGSTRIKNQIGTNCERLRQQR